MSELLPMKEPAPNTLAFQCPACKQWRPGFVFAVPTAPELEALELPVETEWICDNERSRLNRKAVNAAEALLPPPERRFTKPEFMALWTPLETVSVMRSTDHLLSYFWANLLAWDGVILLSDSRIAAGIYQAEQVGVLTAERAARIRAGLNLL